MEPLCYLNGEMIPLAQAKISVGDLGVVRGFGIYEGIAAFSGEPFRFPDHWKRFEISANRLGLVIPHTKDEVETALRSLVAHNVTGTRANIRLILTGGEAENGIEHVPGRETFFATAEDAILLPAALYERGGHLISHEHQRFLPEVKTLNYITAVMLQKKRRDEDAIEILYTSNGHVLECATSNVFMVKDETIRTPAENILKGITRMVVLELAQGAYSIEERVISIEEFLGADEVFITSSFKDIMPIVSVDARTIGTGAPGPVTRDLMTRFAAYTNT